MNGAAPTPHHATYAFLLDERGTVHPLPHRLYVALARGEATAPQFAGRTLRLAEWYVRLADDTPEAVVNETYGLITFDATGRADWHATPAGGAAALPTAAEREQLRTLIFERERT